MIPVVSMTEKNDHLARFGFSFERGGAHFSRTMMLEDLGALLLYVDRPEADKSDYLQAIDDENCLGKRSGKTRVLTYRHLVDLYSLDRTKVLFRALLHFWNPDLNDGVRLNIRPFMTVGDIKKKGAGVLRDKPNIKWNKDRGRDVQSAPWYHVFKGDRINDHHLTLAEKRATREASHAE